MPDNDWTVLLSGPLAQRAPLLATLNRSGVTIGDNPASDSRGLPHDDPTVGWITARHEDVDHVAGLAQSAGWVLRAHWHTPKCVACAGHGRIADAACLNCAGTGRTEKRPPTPEQQLSATVADLQARLAALESKGA